MIEASAKATNAIDACTGPAVEQEPDENRDDCQPQHRQRVGDVHQARGGRTDRAAGRLGRQFRGGHAVASTTRSRVTSRRIDGSDRIRMGRHDGISSAGSRDRFGGRSRSAGRTRTAVASRVVSWPGQRESAAQGTAPSSASAVRSTPSLSSEYGTDQVPGR